MDLRTRAVYVLFHLEEIPHQQRVFSQRLIPERIKSSSSYLHGLDHQTGLEGVRKEINGGGELMRDELAGLRLDVDKAPGDNWSSSNLLASPLLRRGKRP